MHCAGRSERRLDLRVHRDSRISRGAGRHGRARLFPLVAAVTRGSGPVFCGSEPAIRSQRGACAWLAVSRRLRFWRSWAAPWPTARASPVFIAMELIDGSTIDRWLAAKERIWQAVLEVFGGARARGGPRRRCDSPRLQSAERDAREGWHRACHGFRSRANGERKHQRRARLRHGRCACNDPDRDKDRRAHRDARITCLRSSSGAKRSTRDRTSSASRSRCTKRCSGRGPRPRSSSATTPRDLPWCGPT